MLKIENLTKRFGNKTVLQHLNMTIQDGSIFGLVGVNGVGKSTLLRLIAGVYDADEGSVTWNNVDTGKEPYIRSQIAFVSDEQYYPIGATVQTMKKFYQDLYPFDEAAYQKYLKVFQLEEKMTILNLSKGMKRRVALLFALCWHPKLILLDEAYDGLEPIARLRFKQVLADLVEDEQVTVIISSHNLRELEDICDSYGILADGNVLSYGDLLESKENVNKYQLAFKDEVNKDLFKEFDVLHLEVEGRVCKAVIKGNEEEVVQSLQQLHPLLLDVLQVSFEEMFIYEVESRGDLDA